MTDEDVIAGIIAREGDYSNDAHDRGGPTKYGITAEDLGRWRKLGRLATADEVKALSTTEAADIYRAWYVGPFAWVADDRLRAQLVDFGVNSGIETAERQLQRAVGVTVDGDVGPETRAAVTAADTRLLNNALVAARARFLEHIVDRDHSQLEFLHGWIRRAVEFFA